jgi:hypothetical protein
VYDFDEDDDAEGNFETAVHVISNTILRNS